MDRLHKDCQLESTRLLDNTASEDSSPLQQKKVCISCPPSKYLCLPSKAAILILLWTIVVGATYHNVVGFSALLVLSNPTPNTTLSEYEPLPYAILTIVMMFYPLSGFIADICCGRLKIVIVSLMFLLCCWILVVLGLVVSEIIPHISIHTFWQNQGILLDILVTCSLLAFVVGLAGYQANYIQLGLDQLFEAPSQYLSLFIHFAVCTFYLGSLHLLVIFLMVFCARFNNLVKSAVVAIEMMVGLVLVILLLISYWKRRWFHGQPGQQNPYRAVYKVIMFAKSHKHPLRRSAFTHCDNYIPSRLDFAKERFGGPFTTEQVENVKTFLRILLVLIAVGPVFSLEVPGSYFIFPLFGSHFIYYRPTVQEFCTGEFSWKIALETGGLNMVSKMILFPIYIWIRFSFMQNRFPKLFLRLGVGIVLCLLGVTSLLVVDTFGHVVNFSSDGNQTQCVFQVAFSENGSFIHPSLHMHWGVLIPPSLLLGIGPLLVIATTLEFISAQSPQSMKGLLVGVFFAVRGLFQFLNSIIIIPLSLNQPWTSGEMIDHPRVTNCGFVYLMLTSMTGLIGLILFSIAAKRYKYRTRDEGMFRQHDVEEVYDRYMDQALADNYSYESIDD